MEYGLIGAKLGHSYSKIIHEMLCGYHYDLCPLPTEEEARAFLAKRQFKAINVTIPYKKLVMEYCSYIDPRAKAIGAVNTVVNKNGLLYGYNTDYMGFAHLCDAHAITKSILREITVSRTRSNELESEMFVSHVTDKNFSIFCRVHELFRSHAMAKIFLDSLFSTGIPRN